MTVTPITHIATDVRGVPYIMGTRLKISQIAIQHQEWGETPEQIQQAYPQISIAQVHSALSYYYDHKAEVDAQITAEKQLAERLRADQPPGLTRRVLEDRARLGCGDPIL